MNKRSYLPFVAALLGLAACCGQALAHDTARRPAVARYGAGAARAKAPQHILSLGLRHPVFLRSAHGRFVFTATDSFGRRLILSLDPQTLRVTNVHWPQDYVGVTERDVMRRLSHQGYTIEHIDRRGEVYFVRAERDGNIYHGYLRGGDGTWLRRICERADNWTRPRGIDRCQRANPAGWAGESRD